MIEVKINALDVVRDKLGVIRKLKEAGIPIVTRPRFTSCGYYDPVVTVESGRLECFDDKLEDVRVIRWHE